MSTSTYDDDEMMRDDDGRGVDAEDEGRWRTRKEEMKWGEGGKGAVIEVKKGGEGNAIHRRAHQRRRR
jgi:hypothetical protein